MTRHKEELLIQIHANNFGVSNDSGKYIILIMQYTACQTAHGLHLLGLLKFKPELLTVRDIPEAEDHMPASVHVQPDAYPLHLNACSAFFRSWISAFQLRLL